MAYPFAHLKYGGCVTWQRRVRLGVKFGFMYAGFSVLYTYLVSPLAQEPNRGTLQFNSWEQGYKNYIDKKYKLYENADREFYDCLTLKKERAEILKEKNLFNDERLSHANQAYYD